MQHNCTKDIETQYWELRENDLFHGCDSPLGNEDPFTADLKASVIAERIVFGVSELKNRLPRNTYRKLVHRLAELERAEEAEDYFSDPSNEPAYTDEERDNAEATIIGF